ncbi:hypothetical protein A5886_001701 [Enterococcus sp. 8G7_MSG3316]|uniref:Helix-hairpin-helix DNA-binding motif class 1 domain-containing protein n=1 Tax=Candidatus Enterococcus testudinis TaxID=1834191 RepID=A0A242A7N4_9ENTE|nr:helix-hairpin-helix domain-containing protein [Enterococcus sp. 8G7_MSG3316]OTN76623.1 hypothetical protein A5886_001701 [Enterococcus sp. 8G7_MSG3316]
MDEIKEMFKEQWRIAVCVIGVGMALVGYLFVQAQAEPSHLTEPVFVSETVESEVFASDGREIVVDIKGEVRIPGIYHLPEGARLYELIQKAGGVTDTALETAVNLAQILQDQQMIVIPHEDEAETSADVHNGQSDLGEAANPLIDLNQADLTQLQTLPGIGAKKAEAIIQYREEHGFFKVIDDLTNVTGIGDKTFESLKELITVG